MIGTVVFSHRGEGWWGVFFSHREVRDDRNCSVSHRGEGWWEVVFSHREVRDGGR
jgi:hypothetical protein